MYTHILVPVDGSKNAEEAVKRAVNLAGNSQVEILMVIATNQFTGTYGSWFSIDQMNTLADDASWYVKSLQKQYPEKSVRVHVRFGTPKGVIKDFSKEYGIDLIVMGKTGKNAVERLLIGSTTDYTIKTSTSDVLVVRAGKDTE